MDKLTATLGYVPRTIALFRAIKLGDLLCITPTLRALRQSFPKAHIALISLPWAEEFAAAYPDEIDEFIAFPGWPGLPEQPLDPARTVAFLQQMQSRQWDVVVQLQGNGTLVNAMLNLFGAKVLAGYYLPDVPSERWAGETGLFMPYPQQSHEVHRHLNLLDFLTTNSSRTGQAVPDDALFFPVSAANKTEAEALLQATGTSAEYALIHGGGISGRRWPAENFAAVADALAGRGLAILLTGTLAEQPIIDAVQRQMQHNSVSVAGQTSLGTLAALLTGAALLVSNDTGVAHLAFACRTPSVVVYTSADPAEWGPLNLQRHRLVREADGVERVVAEAMAASGLAYSE